MSQRMLTASFAALVMIGLLEFKLIHDTDIFWQIKLGQIMFEDGRLLQFDRFTYTHAGEPVPPIYPLSQVLYALLHRMGGWHLVRAVHQFAFVGSLLVAAATCERRHTSPFSVIIAMAVAFLVMVPNADLRPQSFGLFAFAMLLALARGRFPFSVKMVIAAPLLIVWQNMHPSVLLGTAALGGLAVADLVDRISRSRPGVLHAKPGDNPNCNEPCHPTKPEESFIRNSNQGSPWELIALSILPLALQFATPAGRHILAVSRANLLISRDVLRLGEWLSPWDPKVVQAVSSFWVVLLGSLIAMVWLRIRVSWRDRGLFIVMTIVSLYATRFIIFWAVALVPFWALIIERLVPAGAFTWARGHGEQSVRTGRSVVGLFAGAAIVLVAHPPRFLPILEPGIPVDGVQALRAHLPDAARIYNDYFWAGPLMLDGSRGWRVAVDGRLYFFPDPEEWRSIEDASAGRVSVEELERKHRPDAFFLYPFLNQALIQKLSSCPRWRICYSGPTCVAFVRAR